MNKTVQTYNDALAQDDQAICNHLAHLIDTSLPHAENKIWHGSPVWFIDGNPVVGYSKLKSSVQLLFWSGQSFDEPGLSPEGSFKAAEARFTDQSQINDSDITRWVNKSAAIQWDYKNIAKNRGILERRAR